MYIVLLLLDIRSGPSEEEEVGRLNGISSKEEEGGLCLVHKPVLVGLVEEEGE